MTKLQRARELQAAALGMVRALREDRDYWAEINNPTVLAGVEADLATAELEAEMYGDLIRSYELSEEETI